MGVFPVVLLEDSRHVTVYIYSDLTSWASCLPQGVVSRARAKNRPYTPTPSLPSRPSDASPPKLTWRGAFGGTMLLLKRCCPCGEKILFSCVYLILPKTRKGTSRIMTEKVCGGGVRVGVGSGGVGEEGRLPTPPQSRKLRIASLKCESIGRAECWLLLGRGERSAQEGLEEQVAQAQCFCPHRLGHERGELRARGSAVCWKRSFLKRERADGQRWELRAASGLARALLPI